MRGSIQVTFEEGTQAQWLHDLLFPVVDRVIVCDRRGQSQQGNKGDQLDAEQLSELLRCGALRAVYHGSPHRAALKELARTYQRSSSSVSPTAALDSKAVPGTPSTCPQAYWRPVAGMAAYEDPSPRTRARRARVGDGLTLSVAPACAGMYLCHSIQPNGVSCSSN
jgi:hypothetical protein